MFQKCDLGCAMRVGHGRGKALVGVAPLRASFLPSGPRLRGETRKAGRRLRSCHYIRIPFLLLPSCPAHRTHIGSTLDSTLSLDSTLAEATHPSLTSLKPRHRPQGSKHTTLQLFTGNCLGGSRKNRGAPEHIFAIEAVQSSKRFTVREAQLLKPSDRPRLRRSVDST